MAENADLRAVLLDVGSQKKKQIDQLKQGAGDIVDEVWAAAERMVAPTDDEVVPVIIVYEKRPRRRQRGLLSELLRGG